MVMTSTSVEEQASESDAIDACKVEGRSRGGPGVKREAACWSQENKQRSGSAIRSLEDVIGGEERVSS